MPRRTNAAVETENFTARDIKGAPRTHKALKTKSVEAIPAAPAPLTAAHEEKAIAAMRAPSKYAAKVANTVAQMHPVVHNPSTGKKHHRRGGAAIHS